jgi:alcohol dehydrogenase class IV
MIPFGLEIPRTIRFGAGALRGLPDLAAGGRVLLVTGSGWLAGSPRENGIHDILSGRTVRSSRCPPGEPSTASLAAAADAAAGFGPDVIVAVGGGSVLDTAKALSALIRYPGPVERFLEGVPGCVPVPGPCVPWVAVPTTAGTGAEATKNAVVKVERLGVKRSMRSPHLLAHAVIVDPELTVSLPASVTGSAGLDALTQLVESYVSRAANPFVRSIVEGAFPLMLEALQGLPREPASLDLRAKASYGALMSGIALANAGLGAAHGFAAALGGMRDIPHGLACAILLPHVLMANAAVIGDAVGRLTAACRDPASASDPVGWLAARTVELLSAYGLPKDLRGYAIPSSLLPEIAENSSGSSMRGNPRDLPMDERVDILSRLI